MYTKEQIIDEIRRIAQKLGKTNMSQKEFEDHSTIPTTTLKYYLGTWSRALDEADLKSIITDGKPVSTEEIDDQDLLLDLIRLYNENESIPDQAQVENSGQYDVKYYLAKWKSIHDAFVVAERKYPEKVKERSPDDLLKTFSENDKEEPEDIDIDLPNIYDNQEEKEDFGDQDDEEDPKFKTLESVRIEEQEAEPQFDLNGFGLEKKEDGDEMSDSDIKFIPQTIKPKKITKKPRFLGEPINFRGLKYGPVNKLGVIFLFGMIGRELGFQMESIRMERPDCEGQRCIDQEKNQWELIRIIFEFKSSDYQSADAQDETCDMIVCWEHDWEDCPCEVLELKSILPQMS